MGMILSAVICIVSTLFPPLGPWGQEVSPMSTNQGSGYVRVGPDSLFYEVEGEGPALVLIHDGLVHREIWEHQVSAFSDEYKVVRYDRRGYGKTPPATVPYSDVGDLTRLLDHLGIEDATLAGMSSGGRLAIDFTLEYPERVDALVLVGAVVRGLAYTQHFFTRGGHVPPDLSFAERLAYYAWEDPYEVYPENREAKERVRELVDRFPDREEEGSLRRSPSLPPAIERLGEITAPTLILVGEFDIPDVHAHAGAINAGIPGSRRDIIPRAGHLIPIEQPEIFNRAVRDFLENG